MRTSPTYRGTYPAQHARPCASHCHVFRGHWRDSRTTLDVVVGLPPPGLARLPPDVFTASAICCRILARFSWALAIFVRASSCSGVNAWRSGVPRPASQPPRQCLVHSLCPRLCVQKTTNFFCQKIKRGVRGNYTRSAQFLTVCRRSKWSRHRTNSPFLALPAMVGSKAACKISSACSNAAS